MIVLWLSFIAVSIISYAGFLKLAARLLRYSVSWRSVFPFSGIMLVFVIFGDVLASNEPLATRIGYTIVLLAGQIVLVAGFSAGAARTARVK